MSFQELDEVKTRAALAGICPDCRNRLSAEGRLLCVPCSLRVRARQRSGSKYGGLKRCGVCRRRGHDRRWCNRRKAA